MSAVRLGTLPPTLWRPDPEWIERAALTRFARAVGRGDDSYEQLWRWSVDDLDGFWRAIWSYFGVAGSCGRALVDDAMPGARWFPGCEVSYAGHLLAGKPDDALALQYASELRPLASWSWRELRDAVARLATGLRRLGVQPGDRVAAYLPNVPETVAAFLATASLGAVWSSSAPELGVRAAVDRFAQIRPKVVLAVDGYRYGGRDFDRRAAGEEIAAATGGRLIRFGYLDGGGWPAELVAEAEPLVPLRVPFDHPLWILYSSGTTGLPKAIVHSTGGILLEQLKQQHLHLDAGEGDRVLWFTTTGWMMWNYLVGVLLTPASIVLYDGSPAGEALWDLAAQSGTTILGTGAAYLTACMKSGMSPKRRGDLRALRAIGSTGSPLPPEAFRWVYEHVDDDLWLFSMSGGTDVCTAFVGGVPTLPVREGELQGRALGCAVEAWDATGRPLVDEVGELVVTKPMPSMPLGFWGDSDGARYRDSYFATYPGVWRHGDWIRIAPDGGAVISGRSDATINRGGVRMGTSEIYRAVLTLEEVVEALVVDVPRGADASWMPLFVVLADGVVLDDDLVDRIRATIRDMCSPRHVPDDVVAVEAVPRTLSGKLLEVPVKRVLMGEDPARVVDRGAVDDPAALAAFAALRPTAT